MRSRTPRPGTWAWTILLCLTTAATATGQSAGREPQPGQPGAGGTTYIDLAQPVTATGALRLWRAYAAPGARVMLKVYRPEGDRLVLVGTSPLETVPPASVVTFACDIPVARNDLVGCYCPDDNCVDLFVDGQALELGEDAGTRVLDDFESVVGGPAVFAASTRSIDIPSSADTNLVIPVVARNPGANGTIWRTSLYLFNTAATATEVALFFNLSDADNTSPAASAQVVAPARGTVVIEDLMAETFQLEMAQGSLDIVAAAPVIAHARIANIGGGNGSYGQLVPALPARWAVADDDALGINPNSDILYLFELREDAEWRTNLGVANVSGAPLAVEICAFSGTSILGKTVRLDLLPYSHHQVNRVLDELEVPFAAPGVRVNVSAVAGSSGRFLAYASRAENRSGDAIFIVGSKEPSLTPTR